MDDEGSRLPKVAAGLALALIASVLALAFLGTQVSKILSTVGASVVGGGVPLTGGEVGAPDQPGSGREPNGANAGGDSGDLAGDVPLSVLSRPDLLVIKTGTLSLQVAAIDAALVDAGGIVGSLGGYAAGSDRTGDPDQPHASVTYRIPAAGWETAFNRLRGLAQEVLAEHSSTDDVTAQVVDLGARITNLQATERALQAIMDRASVIKDVLSVQSELTKVRGQIEELSARKAHLEEQAAYSTLEVTFSLKPPNPVTVEQAGFDPGAEADRASATLVGIGQDAAVVGIWFGIVWLPILVVLGIAGGIGYVVARRLRRRGIDRGRRRSPGGLTHQLTTTWGTSGGVRPSGAASGAYARLAQRGAARCCPQVDGCAGHGSPSSRSPLSGCSSPRAVPAPRRQWLPPPRRAPRQT